MKLLRKNTLDKSFLKRDFKEIRAGNGLSNTHFSEDDGYRNPL